MVVLREYSHLKADEKLIAERWVKQVPIQGRREWDLHLNVPPVELPAYWTKKDIANYEGLKAKRIDLVVHADREIWIIEITPKVSKAAVGGCLTYKNLYEKQFKPSKPVRLGIIVEVDDPAYHDTLKNNDINLWVV